MRPTTHIFLEASTVDRDEGRFLVLRCVDRDILVRQVDAFSVASYRLQAWDSLEARIRYIKGVSYLSEILAVGISLLTCE